MNHNPKKNTDLIFGTRALIEAIKNGQEIEKILIKKGTPNDLLKELFSFINSHKIPFQNVPVEKLNRVTGKNHQGVIGYISAIQYQNIEEVVPRLYEDGKNPFILVLDRITDVRNFGAICRTAVCAGVDAILIPARGAAQINSDAIKTSAGALTSLPICRSFNLKDSLTFLKQSGLAIYGVTEKTNTKYYEQDLSGSIALILGSEEDGISQEYMKISDGSIMIPIIGNIDSLNVSVAAGIVVYEVVKQRLAIS